MILYVASNLTHMSGGSQAGKDILISLLATEYPITVVSTNRCLLPKAVGNKVIASPKWLLMPQNPSLKLPQRKAQIPRYYLNLIKHKLLKLFKLQPSDYLKNFNSQLILINGLGNHLFWEKINPGITQKTALIIHESPRHFLPPFTLTTEWALQAMKQYTSLIFVSSRCRDEWLSLGNLGHKNVFYIPNCCKEDDIKQITVKTKQEVRENLGFLKEQFVAVCVASLQPRKNQSLLVELLPQLIEIQPNLKLYLIGGMAYSDSWAKSLLEKVEVNGLNKYVEYLGKKANARDYIYAADVLLLPSLAEAMPLVILEAMALKTPVIASDVDGIPELIENEATGFLFDPQQPQSFVNAFIKMSTNLEQSQQYAEAAYQKYWREFSRAKQMERYNQVVSFLSEKRDNLAV